jgi:hypothetical protein
MSDDFFVVRPFAVSEANFSTNVPMYAPTPFYDSRRWKTPDEIVFDGEPAQDPQDWFEAYRLLTPNLYTPDGGATPRDDPTNWERVPEHDIWQADIAYAEGDVAYWRPYPNTSTATPYGRFDRYVSLVDDNTGNSPYDSPDEWQYLFTVYHPWKSHLNYQHYGGIYAVVAQDRKLWRSTITTNSNNPPASSPAAWLDIETPVNAWAAFDTLSSTQTVLPTDIEQTVQITGRATGLLMAGLQGTSVNVTVTDGEDEAYNKNFSLLATDLIGDWFEFFTEMPTFRDKLAVLDLPVATLNPTVGWTIHGPAGSTRAIGSVVVGPRFLVGITEVDAEVAIENRDRIVTSESGVQRFVIRGSSDTGSYSVMLPASRRDAVKRIFTELRSTPAGYVACDGYDATIHIGTASLRLGFQYSDYSRANVTVTGF